MGFYVDFTVKRGGSRQQGVEVSFLYKGSSKDLTSDRTDKNGEVRTQWTDVWKGREIEVYFDGHNMRKITLSSRDSHVITLPSGCFPYQTKIRTPSGPRFIGDISGGDLVFAFDPVRKRLVSRRVIKRIDHEPMRIVELRVIGDAKLFVTESHRVLTKRGFVPVSDLVMGESLHIHGDGLSCAVVDRVIATDRIEAVFNLVVADDFSFVAEGFVAHSFTRFSILQSCLWTIYDRFNFVFKIFTYLPSKS